MEAPEVGYIFERFPSFGQTFCYREIAELERQGARVLVFSIRRPKDEPAELWDAKIVGRVEYLPEEKELVAEIDQFARKGGIPAPAKSALAEWGRQSDFLRLYQAIYIGLRLQRAGGTRVHAHFAGMATRTAYWVEKFFGFPFSFTAHANDIFAPREFAIGLEKLMARARAIVAVSDFGKHFLAQRHPADGAKILRIYNGIELARFSRADFAAEIPAIFSVGRLIEKKGFADLIAACAVLQSNGRVFRCEIAGEGPLENALRAQIENLGLTNRVQLLGPQTQEQIATRLARANVFALPCVVEKDGGMDNLPTVIMEAMAAGLPVVSTTLAGVPEMVESEQTGLLVPPHEPAQLANALERLIDDRDLARAMGARGLTSAREKFSIEASARALRELFAA